MSFWWLSFADDDGCRGVAIVEATSLERAAAEAQRLGITPGGECAGFEIPRSATPAHFARENHNRLIGTDEARRVFAAKPLREWEAN